MKFFKASVPNASVVDDDTSLARTENLSSEHRFYTSETVSLFNL
jgi:hypothetical protein